MIRLTKGGMIMDGISRGGPPRRRARPLRRGSPPHPRALGRTRRLTVIASAAKQSISRRRLASLRSQ